MSRLQACWAAAGLFALHNAEEVLTFARYHSRLLDLAPPPLDSVAPLLSPSVFIVSASLVTLAALMLVMWATRRQRAAALWWVLLLQSVVLLNVGVHVAGALAIQGYVPGLLTALVFNLPFSVYLLRKAWLEEWVSTQALIGLAPAALVAHGPGWAGLVTAVARLGV